MRVDHFDNTMICESDDLQEALSYFKEARQMPEYIEKSIIELIFAELHIQSKEAATISQSFELLPAEFIKKTINDINAMFNSNREVQYDNFYLSYLLYYLPANLFKIWKPLLDLHIRSTLKPTLKVLDVGTGPGSIPLGIIEFYNSLAQSYREVNFSLCFTLIEAEQKFLDIALNMIESMKINLPPNLVVMVDAIFCDVITSDYTNNDLDHYDLVTMSNFLTFNERNNNKEATAIINKLKKYIDVAGSLIIIEPGEEKSCLALKRVRNEIASKDGFNVYSPCIGVWEEKNSYNCTCFGMVRSFWEIPQIYQCLVSKGLNKARRIDVPFNYLVLRTDGLRKYPTITNYVHFTKLADLQELIDETVNVTAIIRSVIDQKKANRLILLLCDGSCSFKNGNNDISVTFTYQQLNDFGIDIPFIAAEKITLKKAIARKNGKGISLELPKNISVIVEY